MTQFAINRDSVLWVAKQSANGVENLAHSAMGCVRPAGDGNVSQRRPPVEDRERKNSYSPNIMLAAAFEPGEWQFPTYLKPNGRGVVPQGGALLESLFGVQTVAPGNSVTYTLRNITRDIEPGYTMWCKSGHTMFRAIDLFVNEGVFQISSGPEDLAMCEFRGMCGRVKMTGTSEINQEFDGNGALRTLQVAEANLFESDSVVDVVLASGATPITQERVTAVDAAAGTITLETAPADGLNLPVGTVVRPWVPPIAKTGVVVPGRLGLATYAGEQIKTIGAQVTLATGSQFLDQEKTGSLYPEQFFHSVRRTDVSFGVRWDRKSSEFFRRHWAHTLEDFTLPAGTEAGQRLSLSLKNILIENPGINDDELRQIEISGTAGPSNAENDEITLVFS